MTTTQDIVLRTTQLSKTYSGVKGKIPALDNLNLSVNRGEIFGYLGPNGAGKTTTIRLLLDLIRPSAGSAQLLGMDVNRDSKAIRARVGVLPAELNLWDSMTAMQIVRYAARVRGEVAMTYVHQLAERLQFDLSKRMKSYSTGNKRKLGLILALMHKPDLLILDEPSSGLDPLMQQTFNHLMLEAKAEGRTIFISSHVLSEVQTICDRVAILRGGQLQAVERVDRLTHADFRWVDVRFRENVSPSVFNGIPGVSEVAVTDNNAHLRLVGDFDPLMRAMQPYYVQDVRVQEPTLEEIFLTFYGGDADTTSTGAANVNGKREAIKEMTK